MGQAANEPENADYNLEQNKKKNKKNSLRLVEKQQHSSQFPDSYNRNKRVKVCRKLFK